MRKSTIVFVAIILLLFFALSFIIPLVYAEGVNELKNKLDKVNQDVGKTKSELKSVQNQKEGILYEKEQIDNEIEENQEELDKINELLKQTENKLDNINKDLKIAEDNVEEQYELFTLRARTMYEDGDVTYLEILLNAKGFSDLLSRVEIVKEVMKYDSNLLKELAENKKKVEKSKEQIEIEKQNRTKIQNRITSTRKELSEKLTSRNNIIKRLSKQEQEYKDALDEMEAASKQLENEIKKLQETSQIKYSGGRFIWPAQGPITSPFGNRWHPVLGVYKLHTGMDIGASSGASVQAAQDGQVILSGTNGAYGKCIIIDHGDGISTLYGHNSVLTVSVGQKVKTGQVIAKVGSTGLSTGPHLHFEVREKGVPTNPMKYLQ